MTKFKSICVYCGSSSPENKGYIQAAQELGTVLAQNSIRLVYGGAAVGLMGAVADSAMAGGGDVLGIMTEHLHAYEVGHQGITELVVVPDMHTRKMRMFEESDAIVVLPGGLGTLDELFEVMTWKQIGLHKKPIVLVDINAYWSAYFDKTIQHMAEHGFVRKTDHMLYKIIDGVADVLPSLETFPLSDVNLVSKWC